MNTTFIIFCQEFWGTAARPVRGPHESHGQHGIQIKIKRDYEMIENWK
jgi:hypothetical protein